MSENEVAELPTAYREPDKVSTKSLILDQASMDSAMRIAELMASSKVTVPEHLRNSPGDCMAITLQAMNWGMNPFVVAQKTHTVNGKLGYEAQLVNAVVTSQGFITGRFKYEYKGEGAKLECRVGAVIAGESEVTWGEWLCISKVEVKNSPLWTVNPKQQLGYLQVKNWARLYTPDALLGVYTQDELQDAAPRNVTPAPAQPAATEPAGPQYYSDEEFHANVDKWEAGFKKVYERNPDNTPDAFIEFIEQKGKLFTDEHKARIRKWAPIEGESQEVVDQETGEVLEPEYSNQAQGSVDGYFDEADAKAAQQQQPHINRTS